MPSDFTYINLDFLHKVGASCRPIANIQLVLERDRAHGFQVKGLLPPRAREAVSSFFVGPQLRRQQKQGEMGVTCTLPGIVSGVGIAILSLAETKQTSKKAEHGFSPVSSQR